MTIEIHQPELEHLIQQRMKSGAFRSVEDFLMHELVAVVPARDTPAPAVAQTSRAEKISATPADDRPIWEIIVDQMKDIPSEDMAALPRDGASQIDHYIYGLPKRD
jgi:hypothetical protein